MQMEQLQKDMIAAMKARDKGGVKGCTVHRQESQQPIDVTIPQQGNEGEGAD